jgi:hypothetical protein
MTHERLARWVLERSVAPPRPVLGPVAEWIAMRSAVEQSRPLLGELGRLADVPGVVEGLLDLCGSFSQALVDPALLAARVRPSDGVLAEVTVVAANYQLTLDRMGAMDTKQLAGAALSILQSHPLEWTGFADLLVVDQAEQLSPAQWYLLRELADLLTPPKRFLVAGDGTVAGAERYGPSVRCFEEFFPREMHPRELCLPGVGPAVELATAWGITSDAVAPAAGAGAGPSASVRIWRAADETEEAYAVAREVRRLRLEEKVPYDHVAVVSAGGAVLLPALVQALRSTGVPVRLEMSPWSGSPVFSQLSAWIEALCNPGDDGRVLDALEAGPGGVGEADILRLRRWAARRGTSVAGALRTSQIGLGSGALGLRQALWTRLGGGDPGLADKRLTLPDFLGLLGTLEVELGLAELALHEFASASALARINVSIQDAGSARELLSLGPAALREWGRILDLAVRRSGWDVERVARPDRPEVTVVTLGQAKGRRWQRVFLVGVADRYLSGPGASRELLTREDRQRLAELVPEMEEVLAPGDQSAQERRRFFMGISRADVQLTVSWAARYGEDEVGSSRFAAALESVGVVAEPAPLVTSVTRADCLAQLAALTQDAEDQADPRLPQGVQDLVALLRPWDPTATWPQDMVRLSATSMKSWLACPRQYHYHRIRLFEERSVAAVLGEMAHRLLQHLYEDQTGWEGDPDQFHARGAMLIREQLMPDVRERLCDPLAAKSVDLSLRVMLSRWAERIVAAGPLVVGVPVALEVPFTLERQAYLLAGRVDALWRHPSGELELVDYKTSRQVTSSAVLACYVSGADSEPAVDWQLPIYELAASSGALDSAAQGLRPRFVRNWYLAVEPSSRFKTGLVVRGFAVGEESERVAWHDALLTPELRLHFVERLDEEARAIQGGLFPAAPRHDVGTCLGEGGCPFASCCDGEGSVGSGARSSW